MFKFFQKKLPHCDVLFTRYLVPWYPDDAVDQFYTRQRIAELIKRSDPKDFSNDYLVSVGQFGVLLGKLFEGMTGFGWLYSQPYFNSIIVHTPTGLGITVFDWAVKKFSEYGVDDGLAAKFQAAAASL